MISTIDSESTSRSSVNDLSSWTSLTGTPATSFTISARSARTSSVVGMNSAPLMVVGMDSLTQTSGQDDHLTGVHQSGAEADDQTGLALVSLAGLQQRLDGQRNRGRRGVALPGNVARDHDPAGQFASAEHGVCDA